MLISLQRTVWIPPETRHQKPPSRFRERYNCRARGEFTRMLRRSRPWIVRSLTGHLCFTGPIYQAWLDAETRAFTGSRATVEPIVGGPLHRLDGYIQVRSGIGARPAHRPSGGAGVPEEAPDSRWRSGSSGRNRNPADPASLRIPEGQGDGTDWAGARILRPMDQYFSGASGDTRRPRWNWTRWTSPRWPPQSRPPGRRRVQAGQESQAQVRPKRKPRQGQPKRKAAKRVKPRRRAKPSPGPAPEEEEPPLSAVRRVRIRSLLWVGWALSGCVALQPDFLHRESGAGACSPRDHSRATVGRCSKQRTEFRQPCLEALYLARCTSVASLRG